MNRKIKIAIIVVAALLIAYAAYYLTEYSPAQEDATRYLNGTDEVKVVEMDNGLFLDGYGNDTALIFYPGAKIEYTAYLPMLMNLSSRGIDCYLVKMPFNLAFFGENEADSIIENTNYSHYVISGHSLGSVAATSYMAHTGRGDAAVLLSGYSTEKIGKPVLSIYGSNDGILNMENYNKSKSLLSNFTEFIIDGGNHAQFAYYGNQTGDNPAGITPESQQAQAVEKIIGFTNKLT